MLVKDLKLHLPAEALSFWCTTVSIEMPKAEVFLAFDGQADRAYCLGELATDLQVLKTPQAWVKCRGAATEKAQADPNASHAEWPSLPELLGQTLTRAGWQRPLLAAEHWQELVKLRARDDSRLEFILDTNSLINGTAVWLAELFADCCDLRLTARSSEEVQNFCDQAHFGKSFQPKYVENRHKYLSAQRFREFSGLRRVLWLPMDLLSDETLQLASGSKGGKKSTSADTAILRATHRLIQDRVKGLERFFVTSDVALARRAAVDLPQGRVILSKTDDAQQDCCYSPCCFWPGPDQGQALSFSSCVRLIWELTALCDFVELRQVGSSRTYRFRSFQKEMWLSDYQEPWLVVSESSGPARPPAAMESSAVPGSPPPGQGAVELLFLIPEPTSGLDPPPRVPNPVFEKETGAGTGQGRSGHLGRGRLFDPEPPLFEQDRIVGNFRFDADRLLDLLYAVAVAEGEGQTPPWWHSKAGQSLNYVRRLLRGLGLADISESGTSFALLRNAGHLKSIWLAGDVERLAHFLRRYAAFAEQLDGDEQEMPSRRPLGTVKPARSLAARLGQYALIGRTAYRGSENPTFSEIRAAILSRFDEEPSLDRSYSVYSLFVDVFLKRLKVSPSRARSRWGEMEAAGVFQNLEFRTGGTADRSHYQEVVTIDSAGWKPRRVLLEEFQGKRDLVDWRLGRG